MVEGAARDVPAVPGVAVVAAPGSGDDTIVELVAGRPGRRRVVVTADRELGDRVRAGRRGTRPALAAAEDER